MSGFIRPATVDDAKYIAPRLREADKRECDALLAAPPELVIPEMVANGYRVWTCGPDSGEPSVLVGVDPATMIPEVGIVWLVSTDAIFKHNYAFLMRSREVLDMLHEEFPLLTNHVDARNTLHHKWLRWLGFAFLRKIDKWGARSVPFYEFARLKQTCA